MQKTIGFDQQLALAVKNIDKAVLVSTFMRSGTHLTIDLIRKNFPTYRNSKRCFQSSSNLYFVLDTVLEAWGGNERHKPTLVSFLQKSKTPIFKSHFLDPDFSCFDNYKPLQELLRTKCKTVYVTRNLFKVLPSLWSFFNTAKLKNPGFKLDYTNQTEFVKIYARKWHEHIDSWYSRPEILPIRFEDTIADPDKVMERLANYLGEDKSAYSGRDILPPKGNSTFFHRITNFVQTNPISSEIRPLSSAAKDVLILSDAEKQLCLDIAGSSLAKLNYPNSMEDI